MGKIVSDIEFKFIYDRYKDKTNNNDKYKHTSIARCKMKLLNDSIVEIYGYDNIADFMYRNVHCNDTIQLEGKLDSNMMVEISCVCKTNSNA